MTASTKAPRHAVTRFFMSHRCWRRPAPLPARDRLDSTPMAEPISLAASNNGTATLLRAAVREKCAVVIRRIGKYRILESRYLASDALAARGVNLQCRA